MWNSSDGGSTPHKVSVYTVEHNGEKWDIQYIHIKSGVWKPLIPVLEYS
jgi:hypothetical protein